MCTFLDYTLNSLFKYTWFLFDPKCLLSTINEFALVIRCSLSVQLVLKRLNVKKKKKKRHAVSASLKPVLLLRLFPLHPSKGLKLANVNTNVKLTFLVSGDLLGEHMSANLAQKLKKKKRKIIPVGFVIRPVCYC